MTQVIVVHPDRDISQKLASYLYKRVDAVMIVNNPLAIDKVWEKNPDFFPTLAIIDLNMPDDGWLRVYRRLTRRFPNLAVLFSTDRSDPNLILRAKVHGAKNFLRAPFTEDGLLEALRRMDQIVAAERRIRTQLPRIRVPVQAKITFPYVVLALLIILGAAYLASRVAVESVEERFLTQLIDMGQITADWMVEEEDRMLSTLRLLKNTEGLSDEVIAGDAEHLRDIVYPVAVNAQEDTIGLLNATGEHVLTLQHEIGGGIEDYKDFRGSLEFANLDFVNRIFASETDSLGDKYAGLVRDFEGVYFYVAGPLFDRQGNLAGVILIGKSASTLAQQMREDTLGHITFYDKNGQPHASTLFSPESGEYVLEQDELLDFLSNPAEQSFMRGLMVDDQPYREIVSDWQARGEVDLGLIGVALPETILIRASTVTGLQILLMTVLVITLVGGLGVWIARRISKPLLEVVDASEQINLGNLDVSVKASGNDEVAVLAHSFNQMVDGLREGSLYRDLLGRTVSPEVRDTLRETLNAGGLKLEGQQAMATVLMADIQGFTTLSENEDPTTVLDWLNELFGKLVPVVTSYSGVVNEFSGDSLLVFFGVLPRPLHLAESAYLACRAGLDMIRVIGDLNTARKFRGDPPLRMGIGINSGPVTAGGLGAEDRLHYTIIGDTVNTAQRIETVAHQLPESAVMISRSTAIAIWDHRPQFKLMPFGEHKVKGKREPVELYRLLPKDATIGYPMENLDLMN